DKCKARLADSDFLASGILLKCAALYFDYTCPTCQFIGRYIVKPAVHITSLASLTNALNACFLKSRGSKKTPSKLPACEVDGFEITFATSFNGPPWPQSTLSVRI